MSRISTLKKQLEELGLSESTISLYLSLLGKGPVTFGQIAMITDLGYEEIEGIIEELKKNELIREIQGFPPRYETIPPIKILANRIKKAVELFQSTEPVIFSAIDSSMKELEKSTFDIITSIKDSIEEQSKSLEQALNNVVEGLSENAEQISMKLSKHTESLVESISTNMSKSAEHLDETMKKLLETIKNEVENFRKSIIDQVMDLQEKSLKMISSISSDLERTKEEARIKLAELRNELIDAIKKALNALSSQINKKISESFIMLKESARQAIKKEIHENLKMLREEIDRTNQSIKELYDEIIRAEIAMPLKVWTIVGKEAIFVHIKDSISRAKRRILLVLPTIADLPIDILEKLSDNVIALIVTNIDETKAEDLSLLRRLLDRKKFRVKKYPKQNMIGLVVDDREVLFAPLSEDTLPGDIYGIASVAEEYVFALRDFLNYAWVTAEEIRL